jgi:hypothetical protein
MSDPATAEWREAMGASTSARLRQTQHDLAASQARFARYQTHEPEGALRLILAWARPLCARSHAVQFATTGTR